MESYQLFFRSVAPSLWPQKLLTRLSENLCPTINVAICGRSALFCKKKFIFIYIYFFYFKTLNFLFLHAKVELVLKRSIEVVCKII